jgi:hypothetical protein
MIRWIKAASFRESWRTMPPDVSQHVVDIDPAFQQASSGSISTNSAFCCRYCGRVSSGLEEL